MPSRGKSRKRSRKTYWHLMAAEVKATGGPDATSTSHGC